MLEEEPPEASSCSAKTMVDTKSGGVGRQPPHRANHPDGEKAEAFDIWLQRGLHQLYDSVAKEPVPDELLNLIEQDRCDRTK